MKNENSREPTSRRGTPTRTSVQKHKAKGDEEAVDSQAPERFSGYP